MIQTTIEKYNFENGRIQNHHHFLASSIHQESTTGNNKWKILSTKIPAENKTLDGDLEARIHVNEYRETRGQKYESLSQELFWKF